MKTATHKEAHGDILLVPADHMDFKNFIYYSSEKYKSLMSQGVYIHFKWHDHIYLLNNKTYDDLREELYDNRVNQNYPF